MWEEYQKYYALFCRLYFFSLVWAKEKKQKKAPRSKTERTLRACFVLHSLSLVVLALFGVLSRKGKQRPSPRSVCSG